MACSDPEAAVPLLADASVNIRDGSTGDGGESSCDHGYDAGFDEERAEVLSSLERSPLAALSLSWGQGLELCTRWSGQAPGKERSNKLHLTLRPVERSSLAESVLSGSRLSGGTLRQGPLSDTHRRWETSTTSLTRYELRRAKDVVALRTELHHAIEGGRIIEHVEVVRAAGDQRPIVVADEREHRFDFLPAGSNQPIPLGLCSGTPGLPLSIFALDLALGERHATLLRGLQIETRCGQRTKVVPLTGVFLDYQSTEQSFGGFWSQTYATGGDPEVDHSTFDLLGDVGLYETAYTSDTDNFGPRRPSMVTSIVLSDVGSVDGRGRATVTIFDTATRTSTTQVWTTREWRPVDETSLLAQFTGCTPPQVLTIGGATSLWTTFQLVGCPTNRRPLFDLKAVVPVAFAFDPAIVGKWFEGAAISPVSIDSRPGNTVDLGRHTLEVTESNGATFWTAVRDESGTEVGGSIYPPGTLNVLPREDEVIGRSGPVAVSLRRRWAGQGYGHTSVFAPIDFQLSFGSTHLQVDAWDRLEYRSTHHNWSDSLVGHVDGLTMRWWVEYASGRLIHRVSVSRDETGEVLLPETIVEVRP